MVPKGYFFRCEMSSIRDFRVTDRNDLEFKINGRESWNDGRFIDELEIQRYFEKFLNQKEIFKFQIEFGTTKLGDSVYKVQTAG